MEQAIILLQIILIDLVLAADNAIIIGMLASKFPKKLKIKFYFGELAQLLLPEYFLL